MWSYGGMSCLVCLETGGIYPTDPPPLSKSAKYPGISFQNCKASKWPLMGVKYT